MLRPFLFILCMMYINNISSAYIVINDSNSSFYELILYIIVSKLFDYRFRKKRKPKRCD